MIKKLQFDEYSSFYGYELNGLTNFTVFLGQNNSGKTAILDYIYEIDPQNTNYVSLEDLVFLFSDKTVNVSKQILELREKAINDIFSKFNLCDRNIKSFILKMFKELTGLKIEYHIGFPNHFVENLNNEKYIVDMREVGRAYLALFAMLIHILWKDNKTILIDEPEMGLHSKMQKKLFDVLKKISKNKKQIFIATHSQLFLDKENPTNNFKIKTIREENNVEHKQILRLENDRDIYITTYQLLGNSPSDIMMPSNFIIVEGPSDKTFLLHLMKRFYSDKIGDKNIIIQPSSGDITNMQVPKTFSGIEKLYSILDLNSIYKERSVILVDSQEKYILKEFSIRYNLPKNRLRSLSEINKYALEESYPESVLKRVMQKYKIRHKNSKDLIKSILKNKGFKKIEWANRVGEEIYFDEVPNIFKEVIQTAIDLSV